MKLRETASTGQLRRFDGLSIRNNTLNYLHVVAIAVLLTVGAAISGGQFVQQANLRVILLACVVSGLLAIAQSLALIAREIDLALGATLVFSPLIAVYTADQIYFAVTGSGLLIGITGTLVGGWSLVVILTLAYATLIGSLLGFMTAYLKVPSFVVTIGMSFVMIGFGYVLSQGTPVFFQNVEGSGVLGNTFLGDLVPLGFLILTSVALATAFLMRWTRIGPRLYAAGGNARSALLAGINVKLWKVFAFTLGGSIIGVAAVLNMSRMQGVDIGQSSNFALQSIVIALLGGVGVRGGEGRIVTVLLATFTFAVLSQLLSAFGFNFYVQMIFAGLVVLVFAGFGKRAESSRLRRAGKIEV